MKRICLSAVVLCLLGTASAAPYVYPYNWFTGQNLLDAMMKSPVTDKDYYDQQLAFHYMNGIKDGTEGIAWCFSAYQLPHELNYDLLHTIREKRSKKELKGNAGPLIVAELRRRYPCKPWEIRS